MNYSTPSRLAASAQALALSLNCSLTEAQALLALAIDSTLTWQQLQRRARQTRAKPSASELTNYLQFFQQRLASILGIEDARVLDKLVRQVHPWQSRPKVQRFDLTVVRAKQGQSALDMESVMRELADAGIEHYLPEMLSEVSARLEVASSVGEHPASMTDLVRVSKRLAPAGYAQALDSLAEWRVSEVFERHEPKRPCFRYLPRAQPPIDVYLSSIMVSPGDSGDHALAKVLDSIDSQPSPRALLLFHSAQWKQIGEHTYVVIGLMNLSDGWRYLFLCAIPPEQQIACYPQSLINELENTLESSPPPRCCSAEALEQGLTMPLQQAYCHLVRPRTEGRLNGEVAKPARVTLMLSDTGWRSYIA